MTLSAKTSRPASKAAAKKKVSAAGRGKYAEGEVRKFLKTLDEVQANFTFNRVGDAHAAGGRFSAQAGDFQAFRDFGEHTKNWVIEVKQTEHLNRLPYQNYSEDKVARVHKRALAGSIPLVLVCHGNDRTAQWRLVPFDVFRKRNPATPSGSWDLTDINYLINWKAQLSIILEQA